MDRVRDALYKLLDTMKLNPIADPHPQPSGAGLRLGLGLGLGLVLRREAGACNDEAAAGAIVTHLQTVCGQWSGVLGEGAYEKATGYLVECVITRAMLPLMQADCISETAGADIARAFATLQRAAALFPDSDSTLSAPQPTPALANTPETLPSVPSWGRFLALTLTLEGSLSDLADWLPSRRFSSFTAAEVRLISAMYGLFHTVVLTRYSPHFALMTDDWASEGPF